MSVHGSGTYNSAVLAVKCSGNTTRIVLAEWWSSWSCSLDVVMELRLANRLNRGRRQMRAVLDELYSVREKLHTYYLIQRHLEFVIEGGRMFPADGRHPLPSCASSPL